MRTSAPAAPLSALVLFAVVLLTWTGTSAAQAGDASTIEIQVGDNMRFAPAVIRAQAGQKLRVVLANNAHTGVAHNFVLLGKGADAKRFAEKNASKPEAELRGGDVIASTGYVKSGERRDVTFDAPKEPGEYPFLCTTQGHEKLGMRGQLIVQ